MTRTMPARMSISHSHQRLEVVSVLCHDSIVSSHAPAKSALADKAGNDWTHQGTAEADESIQAESVSLLKCIPKVCNRA